MVTNLLVNDDSDDGLLHDNPWTDVNPRNWYPSQRNITKNMQDILANIITQT